MHGTAELFAEFAAETPAEYIATVLSFGNLSTYDALAALIEPLVPKQGPVVIVAESFSGPLAIRIASVLGERVMALILCNSFAVAPRRAVIRTLPWPLIFALSPPAAAIKWFLAGRRAPDALIQSIRSALDRTPRAIMVARMRALLQVNEVGHLSSLLCPVLYLRGTNDRLVPASSAEVIIRAAPSTKIVDLPGPHLLLQTSPREAWGVIHRFIAEARAS
jgi:pimeloyl-ACP methyl ester carboxylesterase